MLKTAPLAFQAVRRGFVRLHAGLQRNEALMHALVCCRAPFRRERLAPAAKLEKVRIPLRPTEAVLAPLPGARDVLPNGRTIQTLTLTYKLNVAEAGKHAVTLPLLNRHALLISASTPEKPPCFMTGRPLYRFTDLGLFSCHGTEEWGMGTVKVCDN